MFIENVENKIIPKHTENCLLQLEQSEGVQNVITNLQIIYKIILCDLLSYAHDMTIYTLLNIQHKHNNTVSEGLRMYINIVTKCQYSCLTLDYGTSGEVHS
jgi:hypothetical protein